MSRLTDPSEYASHDFDVGDNVSFMHDGDRLYGTVVRVYNSRTVYHVEVHNQRYTVYPHEDDMELDK